MAIDISKVLNKLSKNTVEVQSGYDWSKIVPANSYVDYNITFPHAFSKVPSVLVTVGGNSTSAYYGSLNGCALNGTVTNNGCTIRVYNAHQNGATPRVEWTAIAVVGGAPQNS